MSVNFIVIGIRKGQQVRSRPSTARAAAEGEGSDGRKVRSSNTPRTLNALARAGKIDPLIGRDSEVERVVQVLCRRRKNNPLLVGEAGVGKTAIAEGLAWRITKK